MIVFTVMSNDRDRVRTAVVTMLSKGFSVSCHCGGVGIDWQFTEYQHLIDAQQHALQWIAPRSIICKVVEL